MPIGIEVYDPTIHEAVSFLREDEPGAIHVFERWEMNTQQYVLSKSGAQLAILGEDYDDSVRQPGTRIRSIVPSKAVRDLQHVDLNEADIVVLTEVLEKNVSKKA